MTTATMNRIERALGTCRICKTTHKIEGFYATLGGSTKCCGRKVKLSPVCGYEVPSKKCDDRCLNAKRSSCDCSCGGANHGAGH